MGTEIDFVAYGDDAEDELTGYAFTLREYNLIKKALFGGNKND